MKYTLSILFCLLVSLQTFAQQEINTAFKTQMNTTFGNLDKNRVPHGILLDYGMEFTNVPRYNGTLTDSTFTNTEALSQIYKTMLTSRIRDVSAGFVTPTEYDTRWKNNRSTNYIAVGGLYFKYVQVADNAVSTNKITVTNNKAYDKFINGVWQNPYQEFQTFAMTPAIKQYEGLNLQVRVPSAIFYSNYQSLVQSIQIDFGNGAGYVSVPFNQNVPVNYTTVGIKVWKYKMNLTNGTSLYNQSRIKILDAINTIPYGTSTASATASSSSATTTLYSNTITGTKFHEGATATVKLTIDLGAGHYQITKPLIVAEGFDLGVVFNPESANGLNTYTSFITSAFEGGNDLRNLITGSSITNTNDQQYDIIYVDWNNGIDYMQRNAYALEEVIKWVNERKALAGSTEKNVILGQSMGGVIARYALADMEQTGLIHDTRLFVSHDAPQQGANIPVSIQFMYRHLTNQYIEASQTLFGGSILVPILENNFGVSNYLSILDAPASRQLLSNFSTLGYTIDNTVFTSFYNELKAKGLANSGGYPLNCRNISISNGAECGIGQGFNPGDNIFDFNYNKGFTFGGDLLSMVYLPLGGLVGGLFLDNDFFGVGLAGLIPGKSTFNVTFNAKAIPYGTNNQIYKGRISYHKKILWIGPTITVNITNVNKPQPAGVLPLDTYGGGFYDTAQISEGAGNIPNLYIRDRFNFIPTTSSLDIGKRNVTLIDNDYKLPYVGATPPIAPKNSPFVNFTTSYDKVNQNSSNKTHISFDTRNGEWLANELNLNATTTNCSLFCTNSSTAITGSKYLCGSGNYSVTSEATTVNWFITSGSQYATLSNATSNTATLTATNSSVGYITLVANYSNVRCGSASATITIWVGTPQYVSQPIANGYDNVPINSASTLTVQAVPGAQEYYWWLIEISNSCGCTTNPDGLTLCPSGTIKPKFTANNSTSSYTSTSTSVNINWGNCAGNYVLNCASKNPCGLTGINYKAVNVYSTTGGGGGGENPCEGQLLVYPNPVNESNSTTGEFDVNIVYPGDPCDDYPEFPGRSTNLNQVKIYDFYGNLVYQKEYNSNQIKISNVNLKRGNYVLNVFTSKGFEKREIIVVK